MIVLTLIYHQLAAIIAIELAILRQPCLIISMRKYDKTSDNIIPASTLIIFKDIDNGPPELLMVERSAKMVFAAGAAVFPGGRVDDGDFAYADILNHGFDRDDAAARIAAIRETLEETGVAAAIDGVSGQAQIDDARAALHDGKTIGDICDNWGWRLKLHLLTPWSRWRPPAFEIRRVFDTRFYIFNAGQDDHQAKVDATENRILFWASAGEVLRRADLDSKNHNEAVHIIFPTRRNLERLAQFDDYENTREHALQYPAALVETFTKQCGDDMFLCIPDGHGYPIIEEAFEQAKRG